METNYVRVMPWLVETTHLELATKMICLWALLVSPLLSERYIVAHESA